MPGFEDFRHRVFNKDNHVPSTELGHFDARLNAETQDFMIRVKIAFNYSDMYYPLAHGGATRNKDHGPELLRRFFASAAEVVPQVWNNRFEFYVDKDGWREFKVRPRFVLTQVDEQNAHYTAEIRDENDDVPIQAIVTEGPGSRGPGHVASFTSGVVTTRGTDVKLEYMVADLVEGYDLPLTAFLSNARHENKLMSGLLKPANPHSAIFGKADFEEWQGEARRQEERALVEEQQGERRAIARLEEFLQIFRAIRGGADIRQFQLLATTRGPVNRTGSLIDLVWKTFSSQERSILKPHFEYTPLGSLDRSLKVKLRARNVSGTNASAHVAEIMKILRQQHTRGVEYAGFAQNTITHEFGHMLGLPDEYICLLDRTNDLLRRMNFFPVAPEFSVERWCRFQSPSTAVVRKGEAVERNQTLFVELCMKAGLEPLVFGRKTLSLMSAGPEVRLHHGVTLWECLCQMTSEFLEPRDWKMRLVS